MKKFFSLFFVLITSLLCTACVNNLAIQELNQNGKKYLDQGDYQSAIARFQSSVDLDEKSFESRYNLGVAYIKNEEYQKAIDELKIATELNPNSADALYSYAYALESEGLKIEEKEETPVALDGDKPAEDEAQAQPEVKNEFYTVEEVDKSVELISSAMEVYGRYYNTLEDEQEKAKLKAHSEELQEAINRISAKKPVVKVPKDSE